MACSSKKLGLFVLSRLVFFPSRCPASLNLSLPDKHLYSSFLHFSLDAFPGLLQREYLFVGKSNLIITDLLNVSKVPGRRYTFLILQALLVASLPGHAVCTWPSLTVHNFNISTLKAAHGQANIKTTAEQISLTTANPLYIISHRGFF